MTYTIFSWRVTDLLLCSFFKFQLCPISVVTSLIRNLCLFLAFKFQNLKTAHISVYMCLCVLDVVVVELFKFIIVGTQINIFFFLDLSAYMWGL